MSKYESAQKTDVIVLKKLNVKDTDFLLKLIMRSSFEGIELEVAHSVLTKLAEMHKVNLES